jgi:hypothetical protein
LRVRFIVLVVLLCVVDATCRSGEIDSTGDMVFVMAALVPAAGAAGAAAAGASQAAGVAAASAPAAASVGGAGAGAAGTVGVAGAAAATTHTAAAVGGTVGAAAAVPTAAGAAGAASPAAAATGVLSGFPPFPPSWVLLILFTIFYIAMWIRRWLINSRRPRPVGTFGRSSGADHERVDGPF